MAASILRRGGIVAHPTETLYGLAVDPWRQAALERLIEVKGRDARKGLILIASGVDQAMALLAPDCPELWRPLAEAFWPGPLTLVLPSGRRAPKGVLGAAGGVAVRVTSDPAARALLEAAGMPLTSTSANRAGGPPERTAAGVAALFGPGLDLILDAGPREGPAGSTIVDLLEGSPRLLREGPISIRQIEAVLGRE